MEGRKKVSNPLQPEGRVLIPSTLNVLDLGTVADLHLAALTRFGPRYEVVLRNRIGPDFFLFGQQIHKDRKVYFWASLFIPLICFIAIIISVVAIAIEKLA